jgi:murein peptide amidase A
MRIKFIAVLACSAVLLCGCGDSSLGGLKSDSTAECRMNFQRFVYGRSVEGRLIDAAVFGTGERTVLFIASIHGDEQAGTPLMEEFIRYLEKNGDCSICKDNTLVIIPKINPDGFIAKTRYNANGIDLNRNFPADNRKNNKINGFFAYSEPESRAISTVVDIYRPNLVIVFHEPLDCIDYDGPAEKYAEHLANHCDLSVKKLGARPGSLGAYVGETLGIPIITVEFSRDVDGLNARQMWQRYGELVLAACQSLDAIAH